MSTPHCSFVLYLNGDAHSVPAFLKDLRTFFSKFPLSYELIAVVEKKDVDCFSLLQEAQKESAPQEKLIVLKNDRTLGRAESLRQGLNHAQAPYLLIVDPLMTTPLGDLFKVLQNLMTEPTLDICWGERVTKKTHPFLEPRTARHRLEYFFNGILHERHKVLGKDPLCEIGGLKKEAWSKIQNQNPKKLHGWYLNPSLQTQGARLQLSRKEISIFDSGASSKSYSVWRERWHLLKQSIF